MMAFLDIVLIVPLVAGLVAAVVSACLDGRRGAVLGCAVATLALGAYALAASAVGAGSSPTAAFWSVPSLGIAGGLRLDGLSLLFVLLISGVGALVMLYAGRYLEHDPRLNRLIALLLLFMVSMLGAVTADDVVTLFESTSLAIQAALEGLGAVICPPPFVAEEMRRRRLARLPGREAETGDLYWLMLPPGRCPPAVAAFRDWLVAEAAG